MTPIVKAFSIFSLKENKISLPNKNTNGAIKKDVFTSLKYNPLPLTRESIGSNK
ncbi:hypothetical protein GCM10011368_18500 [Hyunsoonleella pacifica]|nr:hypothetical protein GCM10011368_18500 [Hyunsoonleella pacifica]